MKYHHAMIPGATIVGVLREVAVYTYWLLTLVRLLIPLGITKVIVDTGQLVSRRDDDYRQHKETFRSTRPKQLLV